MECIEEKAATVIFAMIQKFISVAVSTVGGRSRATNVVAIQTKPAFAD
jgi:hypothetical protein